jgi:integrase
MKFTTKLIAGLQLPAGKSDHLEWDQDITGLGLRLRAGGSRVWVFQYALGQKQRRMTLGSVSAMTLVQAREVAGRLSAQVHLGGDPAGQKAENQQRAAETFEAIARRYLAVRKLEMRSASYTEVERHLVKNAKPLHRFRFDAIDQRMVAARLLEIRQSSGLYEANRTRASLSAFYAWGMRHGLAKQNPVTHTAKFQEQSRDRVLNDTELTAVWRAAGDDQFAAIVRLLTLTGMRYDEVASVRWTEVDFAADVISLPRERVKNGRPHSVPMSAPVRAILQAQPRRMHSGTTRDLIFGFAQGGFRGTSHAKNALDARLVVGGTPVAAWRLHDLRRSVATGLQRLGTRVEIIEAVLNHMGGTRGGIVGVYQRHDFSAEKKIALDAWAAHLMRLIEGAETDNVVSLRA